MRDALGVTDSFQLVHLLVFFIAGVAADHLGQLPTVTLIFFKGLLLAADLRDPSSSCRDSGFGVRGPWRFSHVGMLSFSLCDGRAPLHLPLGFLVPVLFGIWSLRLLCGEWRSIQYALS